MKREIRKLRESFRHAFRGLALGMREERNFRVHMVTMLYVCLFALLGGATAEQWAALFACFGLTMGAELLNTAVERLCDKQASGYDGLIRNAKDFAAAAVFICAAACAAIGVCIFLGGGVLWTAFTRLAIHWWLLLPLTLSVPLALWFIFRYGRMQ